MKLHDTRTGRLRAFEPADDLVRLYVCGVTPYDTTHLGHARTYLVFDVLVRHLRRSGHRVRYVQNVTDVDDSILIKAREVGLSYRELGERYTEIYFEDTVALNMVPADAYPRATEAIPQMREAITVLLERGHAYAVDGDVFFRVSSFPAYGELSRFTRQRMLEAEASQDDPTVDDRRKEDPLDFPLWRAAREGEPWWESPWGPGRPGWHIECSTLATTHLGPRIDIHGGGSDLVFPHHEAEVAQAESVTGESPFTRFWVHTGMVRLDGEKMSKSKGNMVFVRDLLRRYHPDALRLYLLSGRYRDPFDHDPGALDEAAALARRLAAAARPDAPTSAPAADPLAGAYRDLSGAADPVSKALDEDLDTPGAIEALRRLAEAVERGEEPPEGLARPARDRLGLLL